MVPLFYSSIYSFIHCLNVVSCFPFLSLCHQLYVLPDLHTCPYKCLPVTLDATVPEANVVFWTESSFSSCSLLLSTPASFHLISCVRCHPWLDSPCQVITNFCNSLQYIQFYSFPVCTWTIYSGYSRSSCSFLFDWCLEILLTSRCPDLHSCVSSLCVF